MNLPFKEREREIELNFPDVKWGGKDRVIGSNPEWTWKDKIINNENNPLILAEI